MICSSGLALRADTIWTKAILKAKRDYPDRVEFHAHIPNWSQCNKWASQTDKNFWKYSIDNADKVHVIDPEEDWPFAISLNQRNHSMVDMSEIVIGVYDGSLKGGTINCLKYANKKRRKIHILNPNIYRDLKK